MPFRWSSLTASKLITLPISFRGRGRWLPLIHGSIAYRTRRVHPCDVADESLRGHRQTLRPNSLPRLLRHSLVSLHTWPLLVVRETWRWVVLLGFRCGPPSIPKVEYRITLDVLAYVRLDQTHKLGGNQHFLIIEPPHHSRAGLLRIQSHFGVRAAGISTPPHCVSPRKLCRRWSRS